jgi:hypothetical protein
MQVASKHQRFASTAYFDRRMRAFEKRFFRLHLLTQIIGVSVVSALLVFKP